MLFTNYIQHFACFTQSFAASSGSAILLFNIIAFGALGIIVVNVLLNRMPWICYHLFPLLFLFSCLSSFYVATGAFCTQFSASFSIADVFPFNIVACITFGIIMINIPFDRIPWGSFHYLIHLLSSGSLIFFKSEHNRHIFPNVGVKVKDYFVRIIRSLTSWDRASYNAFQRLEHSPPRIWAKMGNAFPALTADSPERVAEQVCPYLAQDLSRAVCHLLGGERGEA